MSRSSAGNPAETTKPPELDSSAAGVVVPPKQAAQKYSELGIPTMHEFSAANSKNYIELQFT